MKKLFQNIFVKMGMILTLILLLLIPTSMVKRLIRERFQRHDEAVHEVSMKHAGSQQVVGPVLTIPYRIPQIAGDDAPGQLIREKGYFHVLPESLKINGELTPENRKRGIFNVVVYSSDMSFEGDFSNIDLEGSGLKPEYLQTDKAFVTVGISDLKGVVQQIRLNMNGTELTGKPGVLNDDVVSSGVHVMTPMDSLPEKIDFKFDLSLNGSERLSFVPIGKETHANFTSDWKDPSFNGDFLPVKRKVTDNGFEADWKILNLNRNYPQSWKGDRHRVQQSDFGLDLKIGMDVYQKSMRVAKYSVLFIVLTFLVFFFVEIIKKILIHPIQYILVGVALILFYVLMLAFGEQIAFDQAYLVAASMTVLLIALYSRTMLKSWGLAAFTAVILGILYTFIYVIIQLQDLALLFGSIGVFLVLAATMFFSRKIDWFESRKNEEE